MTALDLQNQLHRLRAEKVLASSVGLDAVPAYMADLEDEIEATHTAYVVAAVTEMATLRAELFGEQTG